MAKISAERGTIELWQREHPLSPEVEELRPSDLLFSAPAPVPRKPSPGPLGQLAAPRRPAPPRPAPLPPASAGAAHPQFAESGGSCTKMEPKKDGHERRLRRVGHTVYSERGTSDTFFPPHFLICVQLEDKVFQCVLKCIKNQKVMAHVERCLKGPRCRL